MIENKSSSANSEVGGFSRDTLGLIILLSKRNDVPQELRLAIDNYLKKLPTYFKEEEKSKEISDEELIKQIVKYRKTWFYFGICKIGSALPNGPSKSPTMDVGGEASDSKEASYYYRIAASDTLQADKNLLGYILEAILYPSHDFYQNSGLKVAIIKSKEEGYSEIAYVGTALTVDSRGIYTKYKICQRIPTNLADDFLQRAKEKPQLIEDLFQLSFPKLQSSSEEYNGLFRLKTDKIFLLDQEATQRFADKYPFINDGSGDKKLPSFSEQQMMELRLLGKNITLDKPIGSGTEEDFLPLKKKFWEIIEEIKNKRTV